jgi:hypothetical protein
VHSSPRIDGDESIDFIQTVMLKHDVLQCIAVAPVRLLLLSVTLSMSAELKLVPLRRTFWMFMKTSRSDESMTSQWFFNELK